MLTFKIRQASTGHIYDLTGNLPAWEDNGIFTIDKLAVHEIPSELVLISAYPNPFNPATNITFGINTDSHVSVNIFDISGREVAEIINGDYSAGYHNMTWDGGQQSSGIYFLRINADGISQSQKLMLMK